jgi:hypothetical protein
MVSAAELQTKSMKARAAGVWFRERIVYQRYELELSTAFAELSA